jgi:hypothetical protein
VAIFVRQLSGALVRFAPPGLERQSDTDSVIVGAADARQRRPVAPAGTDAAQCASISGVASSPSDASSLAAGPLGLSLRRADRNARLSMRIPSPHPLIAGSGDRYHLHRERF